MNRIIYIVMQTFLILRRFDFNVIRTDVQFYIDILVFFLLIESFGRSGLVYYESLSVIVYQLAIKTFLILTTFVFSALFL